MKIKCHDCGAEINAKYDPEDGPYEEVRAGTVGWCPPCQAKVDAEHSSLSKKTYLADGLYANDDGTMFELSADRGGFRHVVYLEDDVLMTFLEFVERSRGVKITVTKRKEETDED